MNSSELEEQIRQVNKRRFELINKEMDHELTDAEQAELQQLQLKVDELVDKIAPLPEIEP